jgi:hypothetical protein
MYCPNCAASIDGVKFCRSCGANVSLVPQALTGQLQEAADPNEHRRRRHRDRDRDSKPPSIERATTQIFSGIGFIIAAIMVTTIFPAGHLWGWALLIPGFATIGDGVGKYLQWREQQRLAPAPRPELNAPSQASAFRADSPSQLSAPTTSTLSAPPSVMPPSVTEETTRHLKSK